MKQLVVILLLLSSASVYSQQDAMYTHYSFNTLAVNPAYAGSREALTITALHRSQWVSFPGAPITQTLTAHTPLAQNKIGLGISFLNDRAGPTTSTGFTLDFAYRIKLGDKSRLSVALKAGTSFRGNKLQNLTQSTAGDPEFQNGTQMDILPNAGFGLYYSNPKFYTGLSVPRIINNTFEKNSAQTIYAGQESRHYYFIAGGIIDLNKSKTIKLKPSTMLKYTAGAPLSIDLTTLFYFNDLFWVGPMLRIGDAAGLLAGVNITKQFNLGYSYDFSFSNSTGKYNGGSHEIMLRYDFLFKNNKNIISPRYF